MSWDQYSENWKSAEFSDLQGKTLVSVNQVKDVSIQFVTDIGERYMSIHTPDCCETVVVEDICGDLEDLIGTPILVAEERTSKEAPEGSSYQDDSDTWTFYTLRTIKGSVDIRWHGFSNGYYSESVDFYKVMGKK